MRRSDQSLILPINPSGHFSRCLRNGQTRTLHTSSWFSQLQCFQPLELNFPRYKIKEFVEDTYCYAFTRLRKWFPEQKAFHGNIYSKAEEINNSQGNRKTPDELYGAFCHFHHLHTQRMVRTFQPKEDGYLILWGAHSQAFWDVYFDGAMSFRTLNGKRLKIYRLDHPEWIGINAPAERVHGAIQILEEIGRVHEVDVQTVELREMLKTWHAAHKIEQTFTWKKTTRYWSSRTYHHGTLFILFSSI